jgi:hypothetical protein
VWYITAPSLDQSRLYFDELEAALQRSSILETMLGGPIKLAPFPEATFRNGSKLLARSTARGGVFLRGKGANGVAVSEAAFVDERVYDQVIRAMVLDRQGQLELESTPNGIDNYTTKLFELGKDQEQQRYRSLHATVYDNPRLSLDEIEAIRLEVPAWVFDVEYLGRFLDDESQLFPWSVLQKVFDDYPQQPRQLAAHHYVGGVDLAQVSDFCAVVLLDVTDLPWTVAAYDRFRGRLYTAADGVVSLVNRLTRVFPNTQRWFVDTTMERSAGELIQRAVPFKFTEQSRANLFNELQVAIEQGSVCLPASWTVLRDELRGLRRMQHGRSWRVDHPFGGHDDTAIALALAVHGAKQRLGGSADAIAALRGSSFVG